MRKSIIVDLDGVVCRYRYLEMTKSWFGKEIPESKVFAYELEDVWGVPPSLVSKIFEAEVRSKPTLVPGAVEALAYFLSNNYSVFILSGRLEWMTKSELSEWLSKWNVPYTEVISIEELPESVYAHIDDSPAKLLIVDEMTRVVHRILFTRPWNKHCFNVLGKLERAKNWKEVKRIVDG